MRSKAQASTFCASRPYRHAQFCAWPMQGETPDEIAGLAKAMLDKCVRVNIDEPGGCPAPQNHAETFLVPAASRSS